MSPTPRTTTRPASYDADFIIVGSGAGGGTLAARLAEAGFQVLLLEAGGDPRTSIGGTPQDPHVNSLPDDYDVPAFHALSTENSGIRWDFWVRHYADQDQQSQDPHFRAEQEGRPVNGVLYPRAATLGGCTAHNAMILVYPYNQDWNLIADLMNDPSWGAEHMRTYWEKLEQCRHRDDQKPAGLLGLNPTRHGWKGWLPTETGALDPILTDHNIGEVLLDSARAALRSPEFAITDADRRATLKSAGDPNDWHTVTEGAIGLRYTPLTTDRHQRVGTRERVRTIAKDDKAHLQIRLNALATEVLFDDTGRAIGIEYQDGERLYGAHPDASTTPAPSRRVFAAREVIIAGGAFNTPQLLMLSGIGPASTLEAHEIPVRVALEGVGKNLQDRYEVAVVNRMNFPAWPSQEGATFTRNDKQYRQWADHREGIYASNGALLSVVVRSTPGAESPDLFLYALPSRFEGYFPGYSSLLAQNPNCLTWVVLKARTRNTAGVVTLRSADPRVPPAINFHYFGDGTGGNGEGHRADLAAVARGIRLARALAAPLEASGLIAHEEVPGPEVKTDAELEDFVRDHAWGHHASCTCAIGPRDSGGVLSTDFKVYGVQGLRVVDASVFPRIPGFFIASAVYMVGEKASDVIAAEARTSARLGPVTPFAH